MRLLELQLLSFHIDGWGPQDYAVSLHQRGETFVGAIENLTEGRFVRVNGRNAYMTDSLDGAMHWFRNATSAQA